MSQERGPAASMDLLGSWVWTRDVSLDPNFSWIPTFPGNVHPSPAGSAGPGAVFHREKPEEW